jgi:hypothetical protein
MHELPFDQRERMADELANLALEVRVWIENAPQSERGKSKETTSRRRPERVPA